MIKNKKKQHRALATDLPKISFDIFVKSHFFLLIETTEMKEE